jgi:hypothetical protein
MRRPCSPSARSSASSDVPEFGPVSTSVSGSSSSRRTLTRPTWNGVGIARPWMRAAAARERCVIARLPSDFVPAPVER